MTSFLSPLIIKEMHMVSPAYPYPMKEALQSKLAHVDHQYLTYRKSKPYLSPQLILEQLQNKTGSYPRCIVTLNQHGLLKLRLH